MFANAKDQTKPHITQSNSIFIPSSLGNTVGRLGSPQVFLSIAHGLLLTYCAAAPLSIAVSQVCLCTLIVYWTVLQIIDRRVTAEASIFPRSLERLEILKSFYSPLVAWLVVSLVAAAVGPSFWRSIFELAKTTIYLLIPACIATTLAVANFSFPDFIQRIKTYFFVLVSSQFIASLHTVIADASGRKLSIGIPGALTESGQLVLVIPIALVLLIGTCLEKKLHIRCGLGTGWEVRLLFMFASLIVFSWPNLLPLPVPVGIVQAAMAIFFVTALAVPYCFWSQKHLDQRPTIRLLTWLSVVSVFLLAALVLNLKRGPWLAVFCELIAYGLLRSRRFLLPIFGLCALLAVLVQPARERIIELPEHFAISGGREYMWGLGFELASRFPLGLGLNNSAYMRVLDPDLPPSHQHMHNNILNIAVETGWLGLMLYLLWVVTVLKLGFRLWQKHRLSGARDERLLSAYAIMISLALLGWQIAGTVEYNFGDGEIRMIAFFFMGILLALAEYTERTMDFGSNES